MSLPQPKTINFIFRPEGAFSLADISEALKQKRKINSVAKLESRSSRERCLLLGMFAVLLINIAHCSDELVDRL